MLLKLKNKLATGRQWGGALILIAVVAINTAACKVAENRLKSEQIARINQAIINKDQFESQLETASTIRNNRFFTEDQKKNLLNDMIDFELVFQKAVAEDFHLTNSFVRQQIVREYLKTVVTEKFKPSSEEINSYYESNRDDIDRIEVSHILIGLGNRSDDEAKNRATMVREKVKGGEPFEALVNEYSDDNGSKSKQGNLGVITRKTAFVKPFLDGAFAITSEGDISPPVRSAYGYHLIKLQRDLRGLEKNREIISRQLAAQRQKVAMDKILVNLRDTAKVVANYKKLEDINLTAVEIEPTATESKP